MHGHEVDISRPLDQRLGAVTVVHIPVDDQNALSGMLRPGVVRTERNVAEEAETHAASGERVVARRTHGAEASSSLAGESEIDGVQYTARTRSRGVPRTFAYECVRIERTAPGKRHLLHASHIQGIVYERKLFRVCMATLDMLQSKHEVGMLTQCSWDSANPADVLGMTPTGIMAAAVRM